ESTYWDMTGQWQKIEQTYTIKESGLSTFHLRLDCHSTHARYSMLIAAPQYELKPQASTFVHGDMGRGYSWQGQAGNSPSVRTYSNMSIPFSGEVSAEKGAVYIRMTYPEDARGSYPVSIGGTSGLLMGIHSTGYVNTYLGSAGQNFGNTAAT